MTRHWLEEAKLKMLAEPPPDPKVLFDRLIAQGIIDQNGEVTGHLHRWDAFLAITEIRYMTDRTQIQLFRCLKPVLVCQVVRP